ncbi:ubiquitin/metalloprotease fusion protein [Pseudovirgaria hyperparasitica]|uniref:Ubiquitin/metalloprotease fusion protein n=1 Tax=Pseudovirgaria hyperparasitica TaxID=470096 RepID=A0A6A6VZ81_9PEZI|nr:ubiquitin/metalloprotease fusion protein [Pseudovirgaria hyperparasitica]KAF2755156.1 ubiquitin/metalloprotease fusion protein [Pseudovirgaria hyperparasitica]
MSEESCVILTVIHHGKPHAYSFPSNATLIDLSDRIHEELGIPQSHQKLLVPKLGLQRVPFKDPSLPLRSLVNRKITLLAPTHEELSRLAASISEATRPRKASPISSAKPVRTRDWQRVREDAEYTFHTLRPLPQFPHPERSLAFLERLRDDPGIRAAMRNHKFSVPLLTEMDPAAHTSASHEGVSRTLGLNRNKGEVIELRLRTDAMDGYRDYKTIRNTLCHELAHNVHGPHDQKFWKLCREIEKEVSKADWKSGGQALTNDAFYEPEPGSSEDHIDEGGWAGGEFVLGRGEEKDSNVDVETGQMSRREVIARAAEARFKKGKQVDQDQNKSGEQ